MGTKHYAQRGAGEGNHNPGSGHPNYAHELVDFLNTAPEHLQPWVDAHLDAIKSGTDPALQTLQAATEPGQQTEPAQANATVTRPAEESEPAQATGASAGKDEDAAQTLPQPQDPKDHKADPNHKDGSHRQEAAYVVTGTNADQEAALAELGEDEEDAQPQISTPHSRPARRMPKRSPLSKGARLAVGTLLIVAVVGGVYWLGTTHGKQSFEAAHGNMTSQMEQDSAQLFENIQELERKKAADPDNVEILNQLGISYLDAKDVSSAQDNLERALQLDPKNTTVLYNLGFLYMSSTPQQLDRAREVWQKVVELDPKSDKAKTIQNHLPMLEKAQQEAQKKQEKEPSAPAETKDQ
ncbi:tetratricopeptide repeat protein [Gleimia hominis]|uniref:Tetratricopeptide repeat protein n=1 Tax=Gleimia hominis TaxID=595468 RepID=A0ABU3ICA8_9ACTO|nr:tetratricopeptide repeat protein [Gleimia hominis]MDT3768000.1 tetratricopeptide repeat protein [Gleimia hominis]